VHVEGKGDAIVVTDETAANGRHSLKIMDAAGLQFPYNPHLVYLPNHRSGITRFSFDMRVEPGVVMFHEWRDWRTSPYRVGPGFWVEQGNLQVGGQNLIKLPTGEWIHFEVCAGVGPEASGTWELIVTLPGQAPRHFRNLPNGNKNFEFLTWLGFSSMATEKTVFYLDNLKLTPEPRAAQ
jgi:hypothetical protein